MHTNNCPQEVTQSAETTPNEAKVTSSNSFSSLGRTCKKKSIQTINRDYLFSKKKGLFNKIVSM